MWSEPKIFTIWTSKTMWKISRIPYRTCCWMWKYSMLKKIKAKKEERKGTHQTQQIQFCKTRKPVDSIVIYLLNFITFQFRIYIYFCLCFILYSIHESSKKNVILILISHHQKFTSQPFQSLQFDLVLCQILEELWNEVGVTPIFF